jgi:hypothetical protein
MRFPYLDLYMNNIKLGTLLDSHKENGNQNLCLTAAVNEIVFITSINQLKPCG